MTGHVSISAHAKLNLWLRVVGRASDGYHDIETLFHLIDLHDDVTVALAPPAVRAIHCSMDVAPEADNLALRAAAAFCDAAAWDTGFRISITKRIPAAGGLGGGSSDAAATLIALNEMAPRKLDDEELLAVATRLGADIPFLLSRTPAALAWGRGDRLLPVPPLARKHVALVVPDFGVSTADAYATLGVPTGGLHRQMSAELARDWPTVAGHAGNDLAASGAVRNRPGIARAVSALTDAGAFMARMTGSGSVVFGIFDSEPDTSGLERETGCRVIRTRTSIGVEGLASLD